MPISALLVSRKHEERKRNDKDAIRFRAFSDALVMGGVDASHVRVSSMGELARTIEADAPAIVFSAADHLPCEVGEGCVGEPANIHEYLESSSIPYVGSPPAAIDLALSKSALKDLWTRLGIPTPDYRVILLKAGSTGDIPESLPAFPCICKPDGGGNSRGITERSVVRSVEELRAYLADPPCGPGKMLVERYMGECADFREFTIARIGNGPDPLIMPIAHELSRGEKGRIITTEDKENETVVPREINDAGLRESVAAVARMAMSASGIRDYARCDIIFGDGKLFALEVNGQPMVPDPWFSACARFSGLSDTQYLNGIFYAALARIRREGSEAIDVPSAMEMLLPEDMKRRLGG